MEKISFKELAVLLVKTKYIFAISMLISVLFGLFLYKVTPKEYASTVQLLVIGNDDESQKSRIGSLASLAGISFNASQTVIPPASYEFILASSAFLVDIIDEKIVFEGDTIFVANYLTQRMTAGWRDKIKTFFVDGKKKVILQNIYSKQDTIQISKLSGGNLPILDLKGDVDRSVNILRNNLEFIYKEPKPISIVVKLQDPLASAMVANIIVKKLERYILQYTKESQYDNTSFLNKELEEARQELYQIQSSLADAKDRNVNVNKAVASMNVERLNLRYLQARQTYTDLLSQLSTLNIQVEKERPLFAIIEPPVLLNEKNPTAPRLVIYIIISVFVGVFLSMVTLFIREFIRRNF